MKLQIQYTIIYVSAYDLDLVVLYKKKWNMHWNEYDGMKIIEKSKNKNKICIWYFVSFIKTVLHMDNEE